MKNNGKRKYVGMKVNGRNITCLLDTGSDISTIDKTTWKKLGKPELRNTSKIVRGISGSKLKFKREFDAKVTLDGEMHKMKIYVEAGKNANLFGTDLIVLFDLWEKPINVFCWQLNALSMGKSKQTENFVNKLKSEFNKVFADKLGYCTKTEARFELKDNVKPVFKPKRKVPFSSLETIDKELRRLEENGVIKKVDYLEWASPTVYMKKKNIKIRVCADFSIGLNECLRDHTYPLPTLEEIFSKLNGGKVFSKIDLSEAYLQVKVEEECTKYLTIHTHRGLYQQRRSHIGLKVAPSLFQQIMDMMLSGLEYAMAYLDDILIKSKNFEEHKSHVREVFKRIEKYRFKVGLEKCKFCMNKIEYLDQIINHEGRRPNPKRTEAIKNMPILDNVTKLQSFLGLANYYNLYIPNMHELRASLNKLLSKNKKWCGTKESDNAFNKIKKCLLSDLALAYYDSKKELIVASDASDYGIGAMLLHKFEDGITKPIAYASRALLPAERNYSQIEKEGLAITYAVKKFIDLFTGEHSFDKLTINRYCFLG